MSYDVYVPGMGPLDPKLVIVGEAPSFEEVQAKRPFVGTDGRELTKLCKDAGFNRDDAWITNVSKYMVPPNQGKKKLPFKTRAESVGIDIDQQIKELQVELNDIKPNCVLLLGATALWAVTGRSGIGNFRGSIMHGMGRKCVPTYHPGNLRHTGGSEFKGYWNRFVMVNDMRRAYEESKTSDLILPHRTIQICRNSGELHEFRMRYKNSYKMAVDIEAGGSCIPGCIGLAFNKHHAMVVPLWNVDGWSTIPDRDMVSIWIILADMLWEKGIVGQNFNYDRDKIKRLGFAIRKLVSDTMYKAFAINPELPKGLAFNTSIYTREPFYKDEGMYEGELRDLLIGCGRDACVTFEIDEAMDADLDELGMRPFYENFILQLPDLYAEIENNGFRVNETVRSQLIERYVEWDERLQYEMFKIAGVPINVNAHEKMYDLLFNYWKLPRRDGTGEEEITSLLNLQDGIKDPDHRRFLELMLEDRRVKKTISTYLFAIPDYDGRMKTTCFPCLETGRSSTGQQDVPIRPKIDIIGKGRKNDMKAMGTAFQTLTKHGDIGSDIRKMYEPEPWEVLIQADSSQAEARVVFLLATDEQALEDIDAHDYHALTASWFFGGTEDDYSKKKLGYESPIRFAGKTLRHAGHLGASKRRAATSVNTDARKYGIPIKITEAQADTALSIFHMKQPKIRGVFQNGVIEALRAVDDKGIARCLTASIPWGVDAPHGGKRIFYERWGDELFRQAFSYIPQRSVTDNTKAAGLRIKKQFPDCRLMMESHDALLFAVRYEYVKDFTKLVRKEMERPINFSACSLPRRPLKIPCEVEIGQNYKDFKKFKFELEAA